MNEKVTEKQLNKRLWIITCILFGVSVIVRFIFAEHSKRLDVYNDELRYLHIAESLFTSGKLLIRDAATDYQKILYPLFIMPAFLFENVGTQLKGVALLNCIYTSSAVFPVLLLSKQILKKKWQIVSSLILTVIMPTMTMSMTFMSENVYYPLCLWTCWLIINVLNEKRIQKKIIKCAILGLLSYLLYLNKEIAMAFLIAYIIMEGYYFLKEPNERKIRGSGCIVLICIFLLCFVVMKLTLFKGMGNSYDQMGLEAIATMERFAYLWYAFLYNTLFAIISFLVVPVVFPVLQRRSLDKSEKQFFMFALLSLVIILFVIAYTISVREDFGTGGIRQHTRYYEPLFILFFISFISAVSEKDDKIKYRELILPLGIAVLICGVVRDIGLGSPVDNCMLKWYTYIQDYSIPMLKHALRVAISVGTLLAIMVYKKKNKFMMVLSLGVICGICMMNNALCIKKYYTDYSVSEQQIEEWENLNEYLKSKKSNVLVILKGYHDFEALYVDSFLRADAQYIVQGQVGKIQSDIVLDDNTRYVLTYAYRGIKGAEEQMKCGQYSLYEISDLKNLEIEDTPCFPVVENLTRIVSAEELRFETQSEVRNRQYSYVSGEEEGYLICGPYSTIQPGVYDITLYYKYNNANNKSEVIGKIDLKCTDTEPTTYAELRADSNKVELKGVRVEQSYEKGEIRVLTTVPGVIFERVEITKKEG